MVCNIIVVGDYVNGLWRAVMRSELVCTMVELDIGQLDGAAGRSEHTIKVSELVQAGAAASRCVLRRGGATEDKMGICCGRRLAFAL